MAHVVDAPERYLRRQFVRYFLADDAERLRGELGGELVGARRQLLQRTDGANVAEHLNSAQTTSVRGLVKKSDILRRMTSSDHCIHVRHVAI